MKQKTSWRRPQLGEQKIDKQVSVCFKFSQKKKKNHKKREIAKKKKKKKRIAQQKKKVPIPWKWKWKSLRRVRLFVIPWNKSMEFSRPEYWSR